MHAPPMAPSTEAPSPETLDLFFRAKQFGFSDRQIAHILTRSGNFGPEPVTEDQVRAWRQRHAIRPVFKSVDTCAGEFEAATPYYYSTYERFSESAPSDRKKILILGGGPNRIGQGIEFDYCCVQAVFALKDLGYETIMVNSNPETVSTDYDTADKLYFEPLTIEDVLEICDLEKPDGVIVQFGGQTPLNLARGLEAAGVPIIGTSPDSIDLAEDREQFGALLERLGIPQPENGSGRSLEEIRAIAARIGYPILVRPSYVLGGRAMEIVWGEDQLEQFIGEAHRVAEGRPVLVDRFLDDAVEVDVDALADGKRVTIAAIMEHIEEAGIHSGDSACVIPTRTLSEGVLEQIRRHTQALGLALDVRGLMNVQYAIKDEKVYVLEVNPRASRTVPYVSKATGFSIAQIAAKVMAGKTLEELGFTEEPTIHYYAVKEAVLPFNKFAGCTIALGPEMRSTGEVMGIDADYGMAYAKSQAAANVPLPGEGTVFFSVNDKDKPAFESVARSLVDSGFKLVATSGTAAYLNERGIPARMIYKINEGSPNVADLMINGEIQMAVSTFQGVEAKFDEKPIRSIAVAHSIPLVTTVPAARAAALAMKNLKSRTFEVRALQDYHASLAERT
jgi:carbamoyl-phosphate synthase large subunit